jgi:hypothetical protein
MYIAREKENPTPKLSPKPDQNLSDEIESDFIRQKDENEDLQDLARVNEQLKPKTYEDEEAFLLDMIFELFSLNSNQNILKIGRNPRNILPVRSYLPGKHLDQIPDPLSKIS